MRGAVLTDLEYMVPVRLTVNGTEWEGRLDARTSVLDTLVTKLGVTSAKKGCDHGQCGACTVLADGRRIVACLALAASYDGAEIVTAEGMGTVDQLSELQEAFVAHDGLQCGYCTPGQICSAEGMLAEVRALLAKQGAGAELDGTSALLTDAEIREQMSGNLCRCGAYVNIAAAIGEVAGFEATGLNRAVQ